MARTRTRAARWFLCLLPSMVPSLTAAARPHIILVMADDQGWGQTGYYGHPVLRTPELDRMAAAGLRFDRFYAGAPNCSPTRATVLTGRTNDRTGVYNHGYPLRLQERTVAQVLRDAGYLTAHFGKWHLDGIRGPGVPIFADDTRNPAAFGFDTWLSVTNFFDRDPAMSRQGHFENLKGDSSEIIVREALAFLRTHRASERPMFVVIWYGSPHSPWKAAEADRRAYAALSEREQHHYGELAAMDRSLGTLRRGLRDLGLAANTLLWFNSDNGGLKPFGPATVGGLRGWKGTIYEGGLRVPAVIEWPAVVHGARVTRVPAGTVDIFPTLVDVAGLSPEVLPQPCDGMSLRELLSRDLTERPRPLGFRHQGRAALIDNDYKLVVPDIRQPQYELYNLVRDRTESHNVVTVEPKRAARLVRAFQVWNASVEASKAGRDYPGGLAGPDPEPRYWESLPAYQSFANRR